MNARGTGPATTTGHGHRRFADRTGLVTATAGAGKATVTWSASANNGAAITGYIVTPIKAGVAQAPIPFDASTLDSDDQPD